MKKIFILILSTLLVLTIVGCNNKSSNTSTGTSKNPDFRDVNWGMSRDEVKKIEGADFIYDEGINLAYEGAEVSTFDATIAFSFNKNDELCDAGYIFTHEHSNPTDYIIDYGDIQNKLIKKYGTPKEAEVVWKGDLWKDNPDEWGMAVLTGELEMYTIWRTEDVDLILTLTGDNYKESFTLTYQSKEVSVDKGDDGKGL